MRSDLRRCESYMVPNFDLHKCCLVFKMNGMGIKKEINTDKTAHQAANKKTGDWSQCLDQSVLNFVLVQVNFDLKICRDGEMFLRKWD